MLTNETIGSMISDVRVLMRDVTSELNPTPHYSDDTICTGLVEGFRRMWAVRPSTRYIDGVIVDQPIPANSQTTVAATSVKFEERFRRGVIYFAAGLCYETGTPDTVNIQLAQTLKKQADEVFMS